MESALEYKVFEWLRFPLIVGVVIIHCYGKPFDFESLDFANLSGYDIFNLFRVSISQVLTHVCVPTFYFISGFLFFKGLEIWDNTLCVAKIKRRVKSLLLPYMVWNTIYIIVGLISAYRHIGLGGFNWFFHEYDYWHLYWDCHEWNVDRVNWLGGGNSSTSPYLNPLWFLRDLMVITLSSPILYFFLRRLRAWGVLLLGFCYISGVFINIPGFSITAFFFFAMGAYVKLNNIPLIQEVYRYKVVVFFFAVLLWIICTLFNGHDTYIGNIIYPFYVIVGSFSLMSLAIYIVKDDVIRIPDFLKRSSFFIFLSHKVLILNVCMKVTSNIFGGENLPSLYFAYVITPILTILVCLLGFYIMRRFLPSMCRVLTGYR